MRPKDGRWHPVAFLLEEYGFGEAEIPHTRPRNVGNRSSTPGMESRIRRPTARGPFWTGTALPYATETDVFYHLEGIYGDPNRVTNVTLKYHNLIMKPGEDLQPSFRSSCTSQMNRTQLAPWPSRDLIYLRSTIALFLIDHLS